MNRKIATVASVLALVGASAGCVGDLDPQEQPEPLGVAQGEILTGAVGPLFWPTGPITWNNGVGTWPIAVWSSAPLSWLALDIPGAATLGVNLTTLDGALLPGVSPLAIDSARLGTIGAGTWMGGLWPGYGMLPWMYGVGGYSTFGTPSYVYGLGFYPSVNASMTGLTTLGSLAYPTLMPAGLATTTVGMTPSLLPGATLLGPTLTSSALMLDGFPAFTGTTPLLLNLTFSGIDAATMPSLSLIGAHGAASSLALQATVFPLMGIPFL
jgi:hypothetical protein